MMIWILVYLAIGAALSLYLQAVRLRTVEKFNDIPLEKWEAMTEGERKFLTTTVASMRAPYKTWIVVLVGVLWPTQIIARVWAEWFSWRIRKRTRRVNEMVDAQMKTFCCHCPGCAKDLITNPMVDAIEDASSDLVRLLCPCGAVTEWSFPIGPDGPDAPTLLRTVTAARRDAPGSAASP